MRQFDTAMRNAIARNPVSIALAVEIVRIDGKVIRFAQAPEALDLGDGGLFAPAAGVSLSSLPFELNGATTRFDMIITATTGGTIDPQDIRIGLYDSALVSVYLMSRAQPTLGNKLFAGSMGQMTLTERGYATIECVGLLERASQLVTETYSPVCRADFGDERCKVDLAPLTYRCSVASYDNGYVLQVAGLPGDTSTYYVAPVPATPSSPAIPGTSSIPPTAGRTAVSATATMRFTGLPAWAPATGPFPTVTIAGTVFYCWSLKTSYMGVVVAWNTIPEMLARMVADMQSVANGGTMVAGQIPSSAIRGLSFASNGLDSITITAPPGSAGNAITLSTVPWADLVLSGSTLRGGQDSVIASPGVRGTAAAPAVAGKAAVAGGVFSFFANGQVIFRSGLLKDEAYELQMNDGPYLHMFTPLEIGPAIGDVVDVIVGCDHSPGPQGCARFRSADSAALGLKSNIQNYRAEPWASGDVATSTLATQAAGAAGIWAPWITVT